MALPAALGAAASGGRALGSVLRSAQGKVSTWLRGNNVSSAQQQAVATRLGLRSFSPTNVTKVMKENKFATAMVLYELFGIADDTLQQMMEADAEIKTLIDRFGFVPDEPTETNSVKQIGEFREEFALIRTAEAYFGSMDRYLQVKQAMSLSDATDKLYLQFRSMARELR